MFCSVITKNLNWEILTKSLGRAWTVYIFKRGFGQKEGGMFLRGVDIPMHTMQPSTPFL